MFDLSPEKLLLIGIIALLVLGPDRLPKVARQAGRFVHQVRSMSGNLQEEMRDALAEPRQAINDAVSEMGLPTSIPKVPSVRRTVSQALLAPIEVAATEAATNGSRTNGATTNGATTNGSSTNGTAAAPSWTDTSLTEATSGGRSLPDDPGLN